MLIQIVLVRSMQQFKYMTVMPFTCSSVEISISVIRRIKFQKLVLCDHTAWRCLFCLLWFKTRKSLSCSVCGRGVSDGSRDTVSVLAMNIPKYICDLFSEIMLQSTSEYVCKYPLPVTQLSWFCPSARVYCHLAVNVDSSLFTNTKCARIHL